VCEFCLVKVELVDYRSLTIQWQGNYGLTLVADCVNGNSQVLLLIKTLTYDGSVKFPVWSDRLVLLMASRGGYHKCSPSRFCDKEVLRHRC
jgi:hypothetical protein